LKVTEKLEEPSLEFVSNEDGQVTRITYPNDHKIGSKAKTGERIWLYFVNDDVISESKSMKDKKEKDRQDRIDKIDKVTKDISKGIYTGVVDTPQNIAKNIKNSFVHKKGNSNNSEE
jgi:hypothetical protein